MQSSNNCYGFVLGRRFVNFKSENLDGLKNLGVIEFDDFDVLHYTRKNYQKIHPK